MGTRRRTILIKISIPLLLAMLIQAGLIFSVIWFGGTTKQMRTNAYDILEEKVVSRKNSLENEMIHRWSNVSGPLQTILELTGDVLGEYQAGPEALEINADVTDELLRRISSPLMTLMRTNGVSGAFIVFDGAGIEDQKAGLYLRDSDPSSTPSDNSDLLAVRGPSSITKYLSIPMDTLWQPSFSLNIQDETMSSDYYYKPFLAANQYTGLDAADLGYWSRPFYLNGEENINDSTPIITYSLPLLYGNGAPIGVLGVEISLDYLQKWMPSHELQADSRGGYLLAIRSAAQADASAYSCEPVAKSGSLLKQLATTDSFTFSASSTHSAAYTVVSPDSGDQTIDGQTAALKLYNTHTPFENDQWVLTGLVYRRDLLAPSLELQRTILLSIGVFLLLGIAGILLAARLITKPVTNLAQKLRESDPNRVIRLQHLGITEIDELSNAIELLSQKVSDSASRLSKILELTGVDVAAFEYDRQNGVVRVTDHFFDILALEAENDGHSLTVGQFEAIFHSLEDRVEESDQKNGTVFRVGTDYAPRWVRLKAVGGADRSIGIGVVTDITAEITEKRKIEHDRDYDLLTNIYNRRAFHSAMQTLFRSPVVLKTGALLMIDLDNLKYINDTYGHDYGDEYIRCAADALLAAAGQRAVVARMSGDEFFAFLYGGASRDEIRNIIRSLHRRLLDTIVPLPGQENVHVRASGGISWYPEDSSDYEELIRYADFAMYKVKRTDKGQFKEFDRDTYDRELYLLQGRETLNTIIERSLIRYQFQPIVEVATGEIFAYEALMRPQSDVISTPGQLLSLARSQSMLPQIERLTWFQALACYTDQAFSDTGCRLFVNSIANQTLSEPDIREIERLYGPYLSRLVMELTEEERADSDIMQQKLRLIGRWNAQLALDDFGMGYSGEATLVDTPLQYVKLDMSIIRHIDTDQSRLKLLQNLISYSRERGIAVIAEGVETRDEMQVLIENGVDYLQGFYLGRPSYDVCPLPASLQADIRELVKNRA